jgi:hypothetical protein
MLLLCSPTENPQKEQLQLLIKFTKTIGVALYERLINRSACSHSFVVHVLVNALSAF